MALNYASVVTAKFNITIILLKPKLPKVWCIYTITMKSMYTIVSVLTVHVCVSVCLSVCLQAGS